MDKSGIVCKPIPREIQEYILANFELKNGKVIRHDRKNSNGSLDKDGYIILKIKGRQYKAHRIAWSLATKEDPICEIDHINRIKTDNRIENLRLSDRKTQNTNKIIAPNPKTGEVGIYIDECTKGLKKKYTFKHNGKTYRFYTLAEAKEAKQCLMS